MDGAGVSTEQKEQLRCSRCGRRFVGPAAVALGVGMKCGVPLFIDNAVCDGTLSRVPAINAQERGMEMLHIKGEHLPELTNAYGSHLARRIGICMEVYITVYCTYAHVVEGLPLGTDDLYWPPPGEIAIMHELMKARGLTVPA